MVTTQFEKFNDTLNQCSWYLFPIEMQQILIVVMTSAQQMTTIHGYGYMLCARASFKTVSIC